MRRLTPALFLAMTAAVAGSQAQPAKPPAPTSTGAAPTFYRDVLPVLQANCQTCHQKQGASFGGLVAPMPLTTYDEVRPWAKAIATAVESRQMPPWLASPATKGVFLNERGLTAAQIATLVAWERGGAQAGTRPATLPDGPAPAHAEGWAMGEPNLDVKGEAHSLADGASEDMVTFEVGQMPRDFWIQGVEFLGGSKAVHHMCGALVFPANAPRPPGVDRETSLGCAAPGSEPRLLPDGFAYFAPRGAGVRLDMHYFKPKGSGTAVVDASRIGLTFSKVSPTHRVRFNAAGNTNFEVPPGHANWKVGAAKTFDRETTILALWPHGHSRTAAATYRAFYPNGTSEVLLDVPQYDYRWEEVYTYRTPKVVPAGTRVEVTYRYDNSPARGGKKGFDAAQPVVFGPRAADEMMLGYISYGQPLGGPPPRKRGTGSLDAVDGDRVDRFTAALEGHPDVTLEFSKVPAADPAFASIAKTAQNAVIRFTEHGIMKLRTSKTLRFGTVALKPGNAAPGFPGLYGLWLRRSPAGWRLAVTGQTDVWGTQFDAEALVAEIPLRHEETAAADAGLEPRLEVLGDGGRLTIAWGAHVWFADFALSPP
ncbi:MAG: hypothetical protein ABL971_14445 [Vicinamibacterales bacterium]